MHDERDAYLLCSSLVAEGAEFVRMSNTDLMQGSKVTGQISPKVLGRFREIRNILEKQHRESVIGKLLHTELINRAAANPCCFKNGYRAVYPQLIQKHDHPLFVVLDERIHPLHVGLLQHKHITTNDDMPLLQY